jgi:hypothetical protein
MHHSSLDSISILQHSSHDFDDVIGEVLESSFAQHFPQTIRYHFSSQHVGYVKCGPRETCLDNEALQFWSMVMSGSHYLALTPGMNDTTHTETLPQGTLHANFIYGSHQVCHSFSNSFQ